MMAESGEDLAIKGVKEALKAAGSAVGGPVGLVIATVIGSGLHVTADWIADNTIGNTADIMDAVREGKVTTASGASAGWAY